MFANFNNSFTIAFSDELDIQKWLYLRNRFADRDDVWF